MKIKDFLKIFGAIVVLQVATVYRQENDVLYFLSKPLIMASLGVFAFSKLKETKLKAQAYLLGAVFFSWIGDILLMFEGSTMFLLGMAAFGLGHIGYIIFHRRHYAASERFKVLSAIIYSLILITMVLYLVAIPDAIKWPIYAYFLILMLHLVFATLNLDKSNLGAWPAIGIGLFAISDALIGINVFGEGPKSVYISMAVMLTYSASQAMIVLGILKQKSLSN